jgi:hypothetical protein
MSGPPRSTDPDDWAPDDVPDHARRSADGDATGPHHALPEYWHGVLTSPGRWRPVHVGDVVALVGVAGWVAGFPLVLLGRFGLAYLAVLAAFTLVGAGSLFAPRERIEHLHALERNPHRRDPYRPRAFSFRPPKTVGGLVALGLTFTVAGGGLLAIALFA